MRFGLWLDTANTYEHILSLAKAAEAAGWDGLWVADHFMPPPQGYPDNVYPDGEPELAGVHESWSTLAALAAVVPRVRLGTMVTGNTYRHPAVLAKIAATVDHVSGGRTVLGLGAAWQENEHRRYGIHYGGIRERADRLDEACEVIKMLLTNVRSDFAGRHYQLDGAPLSPKPVGPLPLMIGGAGERRTIPTAARFADEWNVWASPERMIHKMSVLDRCCAENGRDPSEIQRSVAFIVEFTDEPVDRDQNSENLARPHPIIAGTTEQVGETIAEYAQLGVHELIIPDFAKSAEETLDLLGRFEQEIIPHIR